MRSNLTRPDQTPIARPDPFREAIIQLADEITRPVYNAEFVAVVSEAVGHVADPEERTRLEERLIERATVWVADAVTVAIDLTLTATEQRCRLAGERRP